MNSLRGRQLRGLIAIIVLMAVIPLISLFYQSSLERPLPPLSNQKKDTSAVQIIIDDVNQGVFFAPSGMKLAELLLLADVKSIGYPDLPLFHGQKITIEGQSEITAGRIDAATKLGLNMPIDLNQATKDDLLLISGIGEKTAEKIINLREKMGSFQRLEDLMQISGIKEKKLAKLRNYLYVEKQ